MSDPNTYLETNPDMRGTRKGKEICPKSPQTWDAEIRRCDTVSSSSAKCKQEGRNLSVSSLNAKCGDGGCTALVALPSSAKRELLSLRSNSPPAPNMDAASTTSIDREMACLRYLPNTPLLE